MAIIDIGEKPEALRTVNAVGGYNPLMKETWGATLSLLERKKWFNLKYPDGKIELSAILMEFPTVTFQAKVHANGKIIASAFGSCPIDKGEIADSETVIEAIRRAENTALKLAGFQLWGEPLHEELGVIEEAMLMDET